MPQILSPWHTHVINFRYLVFPLYNPLNCCINICLVIFLRYVCFPSLLNHIFKSRIRALVSDDKAHLLIFFANNVHSYKICVYSLGFCVEGVLSSFFFYQHPYGISQDTNIWLMVSWKGTLFQHKMFFFLK